MWIEFYCAKCGKSLTHFNKSHDSIEFLLNRDSLKCWKCPKEKLINVKVRRG